MSKKSTSYASDQELTMMKAEYCEASSDEARAAVVAHWAEHLGKTPQSVRQHMSRAGYYVAKTYKTKSGSSPETKEEMVQAIAAAMGLSVDQLPSLEKATKAALSRIRDFVTADELEEA